MESPDLRGLLDGASRLIDAVEQTGDEREALKELRERLDAGRFHLAVLGQFKRGKSTFLNALLGEAILPTSIVPLTAIPTFILPGERRRARVVYLKDLPPEERSFESAGGMVEFLEGYVTERGNPENRLGVGQVDIHHPAPLLTRGVVLIDTPGIGSTFRHNTEATLNFLTQCDAALFMVSADPPLTEVEVEFLKEVRSKIPRLFFILNKTDYLTEDEKRDSLLFLRKVLADQVGVEESTPIFPVSSSLGLAAKKENDSARWARSGMGEVGSYLIDFLAQEKGTALRNAISLKASDILTNVTMRLRLAVRSLQMPLEDLEKRLAVFGRKLQEIEGERRAAADLLAGDRTRTLDFLEEQAAALRRRARGYLEGIIKENLAKASDREETEERLRKSIASAIPGFFEHAMGQLTERCKQRLAEILARHHNRAHSLIESIRKNAAELFDVPYSPPLSGPTFESTRKTYWVTYQWAATLRPSPDGLIDRLVTADVRRRRLFGRLIQQIDELVTCNVENVRWPIYQHLNQSFMSFGSLLDRRLVETTAATHGAIKAALAKRNERGEEAETTIARLVRTLSELEEIKDRLEKAGRL